jgi:hypothetical protein
MTPGIGLIFPPTYVDNALLLALDVNHMKMVLAATIKAIFVVMGKPNVTVRQCPLAMDN